MPWPLKGSTYYHTQLGLLRQRSCNQRVDCLCLIVLAYRIPLQVDVALDSLDDQLKIQVESRPYEVMVNRIQLKADDSLYSLDDQLKIQVESRP